MNETGSTTPDRRRSEAAHPGPAVEREAPGAKATTAAAGSERYRPGPPLAGHPTWAVSSVQTSFDLIEEGDVPNAGAQLQDAALRGFVVRFNGTDDHEIQRIAVLQGQGDGAVTRFAFCDQDENDPFTANATCTVLMDAAGVPGAGVSGAVSTTGSDFTTPSKGTCQFLIADPFPGDPDAVLALRGFDLRRQPQHDANVRSIEIALVRDLQEAGLSVGNAMRPAVLVTLTDDEGMDARTWGLDLSPQLDESGLGMSPTTPALTPPFPADIGGGRGYGVIVQFEWIPSQFVLARRRLPPGGGTNSGHQPLQTTSSPGVSLPSIDALTGFHFEFMNSDHYLHGFGINGDHDGGEFVFQDSGQDDPVAWWVSFVELDPVLKV
ncbi:hypothetical protein HII28_18325 [Planctomonas sp. JC2975]|uniref:hypothetical protein n=1 Tax=Planctomonas sp. JC2975 TaxID=2729626 RepID=UPI00147297A8|nr:hypothetical protein [Planctomonas sp. JC2975]NNC13821.1 hypothetical protein [Planctomonas sp. JC2975]